MNKRASLSAIVVVVLLTMGTCPAQSWLTNGLVAHYPFNGNARDESGNGNHGTVKGLSPTTDRFGVADSAYQCGGMAHSIEVTGLVFRKTSFSLCVWLRRDTNSVGGNFFGQGPPNPNRGLHVKWTESNQLRFGFYRNDLNTPTAYPDYEQWHYWVMTYQTGTRAWCIYRDGIQVAASTATSDFLGSGVFRMGNSSWDDGRDPAFKGKMDDVRIYNRALSASEVEQLYAVELRGTPEQPETTAREVSAEPTRSWLAENGIVVAAIVVPLGVAGGVLAGWFYFSRKRGLTIRIVESAGDGDPEGGKRSVLEIDGVDSEDAHRAAELIGAIVDAKRSFGQAPAEAKADGAAVEPEAIEEGKTFTVVEEEMPAPQGDNVSPNPVFVQPKAPDYIAENEAFENLRKGGGKKADPKALEAAAAAWEQQEAAPKYLRTEQGIIIFECGHCARQVDVGEKFVGMETCCPHCGGMQIVPGEKQT